MSSEFSRRQTLAVESLTIELQLAIPLDLRSGLVSVPRTQWETKASFRSREHVP